MNKLLYPILGFGFSILVWSCTKDNVEDTFGDCNPVDVKLSTEVTPIFSANNCFACHSTAGAPNAGGIDLTNYDDVKIVADNGKLYGAINHDNGFAAMPPGGNKLSECELETIKTWIDEGSQNN